MTGKLPEQSIKAEIVAVENQKGGTGKSQIVTQVAVGLAKRGHRILIVDTDKQQTAVKWNNRRKISNLSPKIEAVGLRAKKDAPEEFIGVIENLRESGDFDYLIIDAGGRDNIETRLSLLVAHFLIAPCQPSQSDTESLEEFDEIVGEARLGNPKLKCMTVINRARHGLFSRANKDARDVIEGLSNLGYCLPQTIGDRPNYSDTSKIGATVYDLTTYSGLAAQKEIEAIIEWLCPTEK